MTDAVKDDKQTIDWYYNPRQKQAIAAWKDPATKELLYGGAKGGGKSVFGCRWAYKCAIELIEQCGIKRGPNPPPVGFMGRKRAADFAKTTLETWREQIPAFEYRIVEMKREIIIRGAVKIIYGGFDDRDDVQRFNSAEYVFSFVDQAEELAEDEAGMIRATLRRKVKGQQPRYKLLWTANPRQCWLRQQFINQPQAGRVYIPALPGDNNFLATGYLQTLQDAFKHRPELLQAYLYGKWDSLEGANQIIRDSWIDDATKRQTQYPHKVRYLVCDPARFGDDETVIYLMENTDIADKWFLPYCRTTDISSKLAALSIGEGNIPIVVESVGADVGAGVVDELVQLGREVTVFNPAGAARKPEQFGNARAEAWWTAGKMLANGIVSDYTNLGVCCVAMYDELRRQLTTPTYYYRGTRLMCEEKSDIKKRLNRSPDHADTYVIGLYHLEQMLESAGLTARSIDTVSVKQSAKRAKELYEKYAMPRCA